MPGEKTSFAYFHNICGHSAGLGPLCAHCGELLHLNDLTPHRSKEWAAEREERRVALKTSHAS